ncbi:MAG: iron-sulfur cluster assembly accessory protein [Sphingobacteriales bacterium]|jgi:iron-sulfur cluster assembly protein|nr:iron-sulfur cluster assembly accessory protein [Sphingobacteriales bacterium]MBP9141149.1 iron-sulfur cluster assembly accessory protein [Chitinophagales bacterium]MDA0198322.1 iron-sulfur cluster assembly accessory protein [Bacteroidota bacterium]MBK6889542.1 iron-sulfur cluster assembly accessory protein [Sphingobacteriales bacterium]MBK7527954.1 iron-sulfur cluster assembly accessory protein [Sphingobacteriales bacterium]
MITISDEAKQQIANLKANANLTTDYFLRVSITSGGCSGLSYKMDFDNENQPDDQMFEDKGVKICIDLRSFLYLYGTELDFSRGLNGKGFYFKNPNASRTCGCGESFSV